MGLGWLEREPFSKTYVVPEGTLHMLLHSPVASHLCWELGEYEMMRAILWEVKNQ